MQQRRSAAAPTAAALAAALAWWAATTRPAVADWEVHRSAGSLAEQSARALTEAPESAALAARLVRQAGGGAGVDTWLRQFGRRAAEHTDDYRAQLAYAQLLLAARRWTDAAAAFSKAAALSAESFAPRWGRAQALTGAHELRSALEELRAALPLAQRRSEADAAARELIGAAVALADVNAEVDGRRAWARPRPRDGAAALDLAAALERAGRPLDAAATLAEARAAGALAGGVKATRAALTEARYRAAGDDLTGAARTLEWALRSVPRASRDLRREIWEQAVDVARRRGTLDELAAALARPADVVEWAALARVRDEASDLQGAQQALARAVVLAPRDLELRRRQIALERRLGPAGGVAALYEAMAALALRDPQVVGEVLDELARLGQTDAASRVFDRALAGARRQPALLRLLAEAAGRSGDERRAVAAWAALRRADPSSELAIVALGEAELQHGRKRGALEIWRTILHRRGAGAADGHARLAEVLADHDLGREAVAEARLALERAPRDPRHHRLLASILERQAHLGEAEAEWQAVLRLARTPAEAGERREARAHLEALWARQGPGSLERKLRELEERVRDTAGADLEAVTFLIETQLRAGRTDAAVATLRSLLAARDASASGRSSARSEADATTADLMLMVTRALRQARRTDEAKVWLEEIARRAPERARDAQLQLADIALANRDDAGTARYASAAAAAAPDDPQVLLRVAAVEERLGRLDEAEASARRAYRRDGDPAAALVLAALAARRGDLEEPRNLLRDALRRSRDDEVIAEAGRRAIALEEAAGTLDALAAFVAELPEPSADGGQAQAHQRLLLAILARLVPAAYRERDRDATTAARHRRLAHLGIRPLLDLVSRPDAVPSTEAVELLGMLGRAEAVTALIHLLPATSAPESSAVVARSPVLASGGDLPLAVVVALGRLGAEAARPALEPLLATRERALHLAVVWALGRVGGDAVVRAARRDLAGERADAAAVAALALGRRGGAEAVASLVDVARDRARPDLVRRAALLGLGLGRQPDAASSVLPLLDGGDHALAATAAAALAGLAANDGPAAAPLVDELLARALRLAPCEETATAAAQAALEGLTSGDLQKRDEAVAIRSGPIDASALLDALASPSRETEPHPAWWRAFPDRVEALLATALAGSSASTRAALQALDRLPDPPKNLRPLLAPLLSAGDREGRALALSVMSKIDPLAVSAMDIAAGAADEATAERAADAAALRTRRDPAATPAIAAAVRRLLGSDAGPLRERVGAVRVLARLPPGDPAVEEALLAASDDRSPAVRAAAARALGRSRTAAARQRLLDLARDESAPVRGAASTAGGAAPVGVP